MCSGKKRALYIKRLLILFINKAFGASGNVGIGTATPGYTLDVNGNLHTNSDALINNVIVVSLIIFKKIKLNFCSILKCTFQRLIIYFIEGA